MSSSKAFPKVIMAQKSMLSTRSRETEENSPGRERKRFETGGSGSKDIIETMKESLTQDQVKHDTQHKQLVMSFDGLKSTVAELQTSIETERQTRETDIRGINERLAKIEDKESANIADVVKNEVTKVLGTRDYTPKPDDDTEERDKQVIVAGFDEATGADKIIATIEDFLSTASRRDKVVKVDTFTDPSSVGVITFATVAAKIGFYKKVQNHDTKLESTAEPSSL